MRQYLAEGAIGGFDFLVDRSKPFVTESRPAGKFTRIPGRFSVCDCINGNNRRYGKPVWEKNLMPGSPLTESMKRNAAFGLLEHPKDGLVSLLSPISHQVTSAKLVESRDSAGKSIWEVVGEIELYETEEGLKLKALIDGGYNPTVSSRGYGSLIKNESDGVDDVQDDYVCESWDVVIKPSFESAVLNPQRGGEQIVTTENKKPSPQRVVTEQQQPPAPAAAAPVAAAPAKPNLESVPVQAPAQKPVRESRPMKNINEIRSRISVLRGVNPAGNPQRFAESMSEVDQVHLEIDQFVAEEASTRNYTGKRLHEELEGITKGWQQVIGTPARHNVKLREHNTKLMRVVQATAKAGLTYKAKLGESVGKLQKSTKVCEELTRRGQGWKELAESRKEKLQVTEQRFDNACEALDIMSERYHRDTVELGRRVIVLEFGEKANTPEIQKSLKEATRMRQIAKIRETLEGKPAAAAAAAPGTPTPTSESASAKPGQAAAPITENKDGKPAAPAPVLNEGFTVLNTNDRDPRSLNESFEMVRRMSPATAK
jgi:hypothetical protein